MPVIYTPIYSPKTIKYPLGGLTPAVRLTVQRWAFADSSLDIGLLTLMQYADLNFFSRGGFGDSVHHIAAVSHGLALDFFYDITGL